MAIKRTNDPNDPNYDPNAPIDDTGGVTDPTLVSSGGGPTVPTTGGFATIQPVQAPVTDNAPPAPPIAPQMPAAPAFEPPAPAGSGVQDAPGTGNNPIPGGGNTAPAQPMGSFSSSSSSSGPVAPPAQIQDATRTALLQLLKTPQTIDPAALQDNPAVQAYNLSQQRSGEADRRALAERASAEGWSDSGAVDAELNKIKESQGVNEAGFVGNLAVQQLKDNRDTLLQSIQLAMNQGQFDQAQSLQRELAATDAALRSRGLDVQQTTSNNQLGYNYTALQLDANRQALLAALGGSAA